MQSKSERVLRERKNTIEYFPKQRLYTVVMEECANYRAGSHRRSKSLEEQRQGQSRAASRRLTRSQSVDGPRMAAKRYSRSKSIERPQSDDTAPDTLKYLAQANAMMTKEIIKMKNELDDKHKKINALTKQDVANQQLIAIMRQDSDERNEQVRCLEIQLQDALNRLGKFIRLRMISYSVSLTHDSFFFIQFQPIKDDNIVDKTISLLENVSLLSNDASVQCNDVSDTENPNCLNMINEEYFDAEPGNVVQERSDNVEEEEWLDNFDEDWLANFDEAWLNNLDQDENNL